MIVDQGGSCHQGQSDLGGAAPYSTSPPPHTHIEEVRIECPAGLDIQKVLCRIVGRPRKGLSLTQAASPGRPRGVPAAYAAGATELVAPRVSAHSLLLRAAAGAGGGVSSALPVVRKLAAAPRLGSAPSTRSSSFRTSPRASPAANLSKASGGWADRGPSVGGQRVLLCRWPADRGPCVGGQPWRSSLSSEEGGEALFERRVLLCAGVRLAVVGGSAG